MAKTLIQLFARPPVKGRVKTRLSADIGDDNALAVYRYCLEHSLSLVRNSGFKYQLWFSENPCQWPDDDPIKIQRGKNLGERMLSAMSDELDCKNRQHDRVVLIGSDCIDLTVSMLKKVAHKLDHFELVIIPASDGGYVLIAARDSINPSLFENIGWGSEFVLKQTLAKCIQSRISTCILNPLRDIDRQGDLQHYAAFRQYI